MIMEEPVFDVLRTQEQLGYIVFSMLRNTHGVLGFSVTISAQVGIKRFLELSNAWFETRNISLYLRQANSHRIMWTAVSTNSSSGSSRKS